jgi:type II secretory pathway pseudopilin PulG
VRVLPVRKLQNNNGFSLTEVLFAIGTLAVGMLFIAGTFPVAIYFSTIATERTIAAVVADEAFAKIRLYAVGDPNDPADVLDFSKLETGRLTAFNNVIDIDPNEFAYPSTGTDISEKKYFWSALCRRVAADPNTPLVQVTVFVSRKIGGGATYRVRNSGGAFNSLGSFYPMPIDVVVSQISPDANELSIINPDEKTFINDGYTIVDDENGQIYRVLERYAALDDDRIRLDRPWVPGIVLPDKVWVVPPPVNGGRYPCIAIYQKVIRF